MPITALLANKTESAAGNKIRESPRKYRQNRMWFLIRNETSLLLMVGVSSWCNG